MLHLLQTPMWAVPDELPSRLPVTLPAALLVVLATHKGWVTREALAEIVWPGMPGAEQRAHLRRNLNRAKQILSSWGQAEALVAEPTRLCLSLRTDLALLRTAQDRTDAGALAQLDPQRWLQGWRLPGHGTLLEWLDEAGEQLRDEWLSAVRRSTVSVTSRASAVPAGREVEWQRLGACQAPALLILGEPGSGKTTLLRAAWPAAPYVRGLEGVNSMEYRPLVDALRARLPQLLQALRRPGSPLHCFRLDLARILPELAPDEALPPLDKITARSRLVEALVRAFEALGPVLVIDDLQWCDPLTVEWLLMVAHDRRLHWRAAARSHEIGAGIQSLLQALRNSFLLEEVNLLALNEDALARVCRRTFPEQDFGADRCARLLASSGGNILLLVDLVKAGVDPGPASVPKRVQASVARLARERLRQLSASARFAVEAAVVFVQPVPPAALCESDEVDRDSPIPPWQQGLAAGLLREEGDTIVCRHDMYRQAIGDELGVPRRAQLHRHAALWLASQPGADALTIAEHWNAAGEPQTGLSWRYRAAAQLKERGRFDEAQALWSEVAETSSDVALALLARLELAACDLFDDLQRGEAALHAVRVQLPAVADIEQRSKIEGRLKVALIENYVFAGNLGQAREHAKKLRELLPIMPAQDQIGAVEVLIELAMREPAIATAWALLGQLRSLAPGRPALLSFEGQIHWFGGQVQAAHDALAKLLDRHPEYCQGITVENDLAVMLQALGRIPEAETMARRSLHTWAGVAHTETLSLLALGLILTSAGRSDEADVALLRALALAQAQRSEGFEAEARVRRARLLLQCGDALAAQHELDLAAPLLQDSMEPLRVSQWACMQVRAEALLGRAPPMEALRRLSEIGGRSEHPLVHARLARVTAIQALMRGDAAAALSAAEQEAVIARAAGLQEVLAEAWWLQAQASRLAGQACERWLPLAESALALAQRSGLGGLSVPLKRWIDGPLEAGTVLGV